jgi:oligoendopeptidase F
MINSSSSAAAAAAPAADLNRLPQWDLSDLYPGPESAELKRDLAQIDADCRAFDAAYRGQIATLAAGPDAPARLLEAVKRYEALDDLMGRALSYASLVHAADTADPVRAKFYGDVQERITAASTHLLFFTIDLNRLEDAVLERVLTDPDLAHYRPWFADIRRDKPYQLEERIEQLFHEKSVTAYTAWNRLFDETIASLRFAVDGETLTIEPTLNLLQDPREPKRRAAATALAETFSANLRLFALITNTLAKDKEISDRWRGFSDVAAARWHRRRAASEPP